MAPDRDEVRQASLRLPDRQRAALELRERKGLSYAQIAATLETSAGSVAQLIERGRINLYDELRGTALASVAAPSAECERALPLIAARQDRELASSSEDATWLDTHLSGCDRCQLAARQMEAAAALYRGEAPASAAVTPAAPVTSSSDPAARSRRHVSRHTALAAGLAGLALCGVIVALVANDGSPDAAPPAAEAAAGRNAAPAISAAHVVAADDVRSAAKHAAAKRGAGTPALARSQPGPGDSSAVPAYARPEGFDGGSRGPSASSPPSSSGDTAVQPARQKSTPEPEPKPPPSSAQASQPTTPPAPETTPAPAEEPTPPAEEPTTEHGHQGEPPGKPADRPPRG